MNALKRRTRIAAGTLALLAAVGIVAWSARAGSMLMQPTTVVVVKLSKVLEQLDQRAAAQADLMKLRDQVNAEQTRRETQINEKRERLATLAGSERAALEDEIRLELLEFQAWIQFETDRVDLEKALLLQDLWRSVERSIQEMAESEGYDIVLFDDSQTNLRVNPDAPMSREVQVMQQLSSKRVAYATPVVDVTEDLITRMNNAFRAGS